MRNYEWQQRCTVAFQNRMTESRRTGDPKFKNFLAAVCGGAGKTRWATGVGKLLLAEGAKLVIVVATTKNVRKGWRDEFHKQGINLCGNWAGQAWHGRYQRKYSGLVITYNSLGKHASRIAGLCDQFKGEVVVILDEIHHMAEAKNKDKMTWGDKAKAAFANVLCRILVSGTVFRTDKKTIPFVEYEWDEKEEDWKGIAHFKYLYRHGVANGICRDIEFQLFEGTVSWECEDKEMVVTFDTNLDKRDSSLRLNIATDIAQPLLQETIRKAHARLLMVRRTHHEAGGIIWAKDIPSAEAIRDWMELNLNLRPVLVVGEGERGKFAQDDIDRFRNGSTPWVISVAMIIEGTDIQRLRVGVYASNVNSLLRFLQAAWRLGRRMNDDELDKVAYMFIPKDPILISHAKLLKKECLVGVEMEEPDQPQGGGGDRKKKVITGQSAVGGLGNSLYSQDEDTLLECPADRLAEAERLVEITASAGVSMTLAQAWQIIKKTGMMTTVSGTENGSLGDVISEPGLHPDEAFARLRTEVMKRARKLAVDRKKFRDGQAFTMSEKDFSAVNNEWLGRGGRAADDPARDDDDLKAKLAWLNKEITDLETKAKLKRRLEREERRAK